MLNIPVISWATTIRISHLTVFLKFWSRVPLKKLSLVREPLWFQSWQVGIGSSKLTSHCWRRLIQISNKQQQQLGKECWGCLLAMKRFWRKKSGLSLTRLHCLIFCNSYSGLIYNWTLEMIIQVTSLQFKRKCLLLQFLFVGNFIFVVNFS